MNDRTAGNRSARRALPLARYLLLAGCLLSIGLLPGAASAVSFDVAITLPSALSGTSAKLAFDLIDGDGLADNTATIAAFSPVAELGAASPSPST